MFQPYFLLCILFLDYEFLKRVASYLGLQLNCDRINPDNVFYFGTPESKYYKLEEDIDYKASIDIKKYRQSSDQSKAAWFRYTPPTGNIMYSMPIVGTSANLYFPSERSNDPLVIGCVRKNGSSSEKFSNVNNRYFATESGNNLDLLPGAINFTTPGLSATFNDGGGINLNSSSTLSLNAGYGGLFAGYITIHGKSKIVAQKGGSFISLEGEFFNDAGIVMENGSDRASNSNFTDDDPQNGVAEAKEALEAQMNEAALVDANEGALGTIADLSDKPLVQLEDVNSLPEYKVGMNAPDGTRMRAVGLDGKLR